jgi:CxxC-x17-CxxC domain-containing protein
MTEYRSARFPRKPFDRKGGFGGGKQMYKANCSKCGKLCELPFRPNGKKPVFCNDCFVRDEGDAPRGRREFSPRPSFHHERPAMRPQFERPQPQRDDRELAALKSELVGINEKLTRLIAAVEASRVVPEAAPAKRSVAKKRVSKKA